jgi:protein-disulfide isomerase
VEFSEFQCPYCGRAAKTMHELAQAFPKEVRLVFMHNPLGFHKQAQLAAEAAQAVFVLKGADAFWKYHDKLFANPKELGRENLEKWAAELGVDMTKLKAALDQRTYQKLVKSQQRLVTKLGARGAPAFYINGRFVSGARSLDFFKSQVQAALGRAQKIMAKGVKPQDVYAHLMKKAKTRAVFTQ